MASSYKYINTNDRVVSTTEQVESVSYTSASTITISPYSHFSKVKDSSAVNVFDVAAGRSATTTTVPVATASAQTREEIVYNEMAKVLIGHNTDGTIPKFSIDANSDAEDNIFHNMIFFNLPRSQFKDKIKSGTFKLEFLPPSFTNSLFLVDKSGSMAEAIVREAETEVGLLIASASSGVHYTFNSTNVTGGLIFYEAGVAAVSPYIFALSGTAANPTTSIGDIFKNQRGMITGSTAPSLSASYNIGQLFYSGSQNDVAFGVGRSVKSVSYSAITELNSTIYFCRAFNNEFNYSSNPTYLSSSQIIVKEDDPMAQPVSYITTVGLYDDNNQLLAVAKLSEPIKKTPDTELIARVRLDF
jgi:hypothetical protein